MIETQQRRIDPTVPEMLLRGEDSYTWEAAFSEAKLKPDDIATVAGAYIEDGYYAETTVFAYGQLHDGRWFFMEAGCDTTGWDCQAGGSHETAPSYEQLVAMVMTQEQRAALGVCSSVVMPADADG
jgi:hypothetical protein